MLFRENEDYDTIACRPLTIMGTNFGNKSRHYLAHINQFSRHDSSFDVTIKTQGCPQTVAGATNETKQK